MLCSATGNSLETRSRSKCKGPREGTQTFPQYQERNNSSLSGGGDRRKASGGLFSIARYFSCRRGLVENSMSRSRAACPSVGAGCAEQSAAAPSAFVRGQCWGDGLRVHAGSPLLAAEETSPKETGLFFLPPSLSFCDISGC